jgi:hypothetical protein
VLETGSIPPHESPKRSTATWLSPSPSRSPSTSPTRCSSPEPGESAAGSPLLDRRTTHRLREWFAGCSGPDYLTMRGTSLPGDSHVKDRVNRTSGAQVCALRISFTTLRYPKTNAQINGVKSNLWIWTKPRHGDSTDPMRVRAVIANRTDPSVLAEVEVLTHPMG